MPVPRPPSNRSLGHSGSVRTTVIRLICGLFACSSWLTIAGFVAAKEPADAFFSELRKRGYLDTAVDYLDWADRSPLIEDAWRQRIPYHRAVLLVEQAAKQTPENAAATTAEAEQLFADFVADHGDYSEAKMSSFWLGRILADKARRELKTVTDEMTGAAKRKIRGPAADKFVQAQTEFATSSAFFQAQLESMKNSKADFDARLRDQYRAYYLEGELNRAIIDYELAETVQTNKKKYADQLKVAKDSLGAFAVQQSKRLAGVQAKIYQGRCFEDLDEVEDALAIYQEVIDEPSLPELFSSQAVLRSINCSIEKKNNPAAAVTTGLNWLKVRSPEPTSQPAQAVRLAVAEHIVAALPNLDSGEQRKMRSEAKQLLADAGRAGGSGQARAAELLAGLGFEPTVGPVVDISDAKSFDEARGAAERLRAELQPLLDAEKLLTENLARTEDATNRAEIENQLAKSRRTLQVTRDGAILAYRQAISMASEEDDQDALFESIYVCGYLYYTAEAFREAAVMSQYVAQAAPNLPNAKAAASIALASFVKLYQGAGKDNSAEASFLVRISTFIADTWPGSQEAQDSLTMLIGFMVNDGKLDQAEVFLQKIPESSSRRAEAELRTGQAIWRSYLRSVQSRQASTSDDNERMKQRAQSLLRQGLDRARSEAPTAMVAQGALALAQIYVDINEPAKATTLLTDDQLGPLALIGKSDPAASSTGFLEQTYKCALRAEIASLAEPDTDAKVAVAAAMKTMDALSTAVGDTPAGKQRLTATYIGLAKDLQRQLKLSSSETRGDIAQAFESFLNQVAMGSNDPSVLNWVAETYFSLAEGEHDLASNSPAAVEYYASSADVFGDMLKRHAEGALSLDDALLLQVRVRSATTNLKAARFKQAFDLFEQVLSERNMMLNVQVDAAKALQTGGRRGNADMFNQAVKGARPQESKNVIWGWEKISKIAAAQMRKSPEARAKFAETFFEARYNIARCRHLQSVASTGEVQTKLAGSAKRAIAMTANLYPDMGGETWRRKFDKLMKEVQQALGEDAIGLRKP